jgi:hypothetical protein
LPPTNSSAARQEADERRVEGAQAGGHHRLLEDTLGGAVEAAQLTVLLGERLDHPHAADVLLGLSRQLGDALLDLLAGGPVAAPVAERDPDHERHRRERDQRQPRVQHDHHGGGDHDRERRLEDEDQAVAEEEAHRLQVDGRP